MRLRELYIDDYKVLKNFKLTFDSQSGVTALIGENGAGKTTIIESLTIIFAELFRQSFVSDLYEKATFPFNFRIKYRLFRESTFDKTFDQSFGSGHYDVEITYEKALYISVLTDNGSVYDTPERISEFLQDEGQIIRPIRYLFPANLIIYYSGISTLLKDIFTDYEHKMIVNTIVGESKVNPDLFYFQPDNFPALLIGLLSFRYGNIPDQLESDFGIKKIDPFDRIIIKVRRPKWAKPRTRSDTFWGAKGDIANFLAVLRDRTKAKFDGDTITFTILSTYQLSEVWRFYGEEKSLFEYIVTLQANDLIDQIEIDLRKDIHVIVPYQRLSEGEKQLLIIIALRELFAADENSLFLLDEPDTYLHPEWKRNFIAQFLLKGPNAEKYLAHYLITTHSPGIVSGIKKNQLHILQKVNNLSVQKVFSFNPYGKPEDQILFDFFGLDGLRYKPVQEKLEELQILINNGDYDSDLFHQQFSQLETEIGKSDEGLMRLKLEVARRKQAS